MVILDNGHIFQYNLPRIAAKLTRLHNKCVTRLHIYTVLQEIWARSDWGWFPLVVGTEATASDTNRGTLTSKIRRKLWRHNLSLSLPKPQWELRETEEQGHPCVMQWWIKCSAFTETKQCQRFVLNFCNFLMSDRWTSTHDHIYTSIGSKEAENRYFYMHNSRTTIKRKSRLVIYL